jgi:protease I
VADCGLQSAAPDKTFRLSSGRSVHAADFEKEHNMAVSGMKIAFLATDGVEQVELTKPYEALKKEGAQVTLVSPEDGQIQAMNHDEKGDKIKVDRKLDSARPEEFDALVLPGGVANPDYMRVNPQAVAFVKHFVDQKKPIAAICHGPWTLIEAGGVKGKTMTSWPSLKTDLSNAGAQWVDREVVNDGLLVTSRKPDDIPAFVRAFTELLNKQGAKQAA